MTRTTIRIAGDDRISDTVIDAVSAATGTDPLDLSPLYETIDPDALDRLFRGDGQRQWSVARIEFAVAGCDVSVHGDGRVVVVPSGSEPKSQAVST